MAFNRRKMRTARYLRISSRDRLKPSENNLYNFSVSFNDYSLNQVSKVVVKSIMIPNTAYNINETNNSVLLNYNGTGDVGFQLPVGQYDSASLITALEAEFLGVGATVTITENAVNKKWILTFALPTVLYGLEQGSTLASVIGYEFTTQNIAVHTMPYLRDLVGLKKVFVGSNTLSNTTNMISSDDRRVHILTECDITVPYGFIEHRVVTELDTSDEITYHQPKNISYVDLTLYDDRLNRLDLNGHHWEIVLKVFE